MTQNVVNASLIRKYLLGDLAPEERVRVEDEYFANADFFEEVIAAENDLIDSYARGGLSNFERAKFEETCKASPKRMARVHFARALAQVVESEKKVVPARATPLWAWFSSLFAIPRPQLAWALGAAVFVGVSLLSLQTYKLRGELRDARAESARILREDSALRAQITALTEKPQLLGGGENNQFAKVEPPADFPFRLVPGATRSANAGRDLVLPHSGAWVRLELVLDRDEFSTYEAVLQTAEGKDVAHSKGLKSTSIRGNRVVFWRVPSGSISPGDYALRLSGEVGPGHIEESESYSFRASLR